MTGICGGGASQPKANVAALIDLGGNAAALAAEIAAVPGLAEVISIVLAGQAITSGPFCAGHPPAAPTLQLTDFSNIIAPTDPIALATASRHVVDWFLHWYWWEICECTSVATPTQPTPVLPPGYGKNTGLPPGGLSQPCWTASTTVHAVATPGTQPVPVTDVTDRVLPLGPKITVTNAPTLNIPPAVPFPAGFTSGTMIMNAQHQPAAPGSVGLTINFCRDDGSYVTSIQAYITSTSPSTGATTTIFLPSGATHWSAAVSNIDTSGAQDVQASVVLECSGSPPGSIVTPCCPPDPLLEAYLQQILAILKNLYITPPAAPSTSWTPGVSHAGLSGQGSFQLAKGVTAVRATFSVIPPAIRTTPGTPTFYWDLGFVTPVAIDVPLRSLRTVFSPQDLPLPVQTTAIDYTFPAGAIVTLTELLPL